MSVFFVLKEERMKKLGKILLAGVFAVASIGILSCSSGGGQARMTMRTQLQKNL
jgi:hypothetical protein